MITTDIIFQLRKGNSIRDFNRRFESFSERAKPLYDESDDFEYKRISPDERELFGEETYNELIELEEKFARTFLITNLNNKEYIDVFSALNRDSILDDAIVQFVQDSFIYEVNYAPQANRTATRNFTSRGIQDMRCFDAWNETRRRGKGIVVAVIDGGVDYCHLYIKDNMWEMTKNGMTVHGRDFVNNNWKPLDEDGHGTHCAGIIAAKVINGNRISVAPDAKIMALKISGRQKPGSRLKDNQTDTPLSVRAIRFAACFGAKVLSNSWSSTEKENKDPVFLEAIDYAYKKKCIVVFAAGNAIPRLNITSSFPGNNLQVIPVASTNETNSLLADSNYVSGTIIAALGKNVWSLQFNSKDQFVQDTGTSMAAPHVAGLAALLLDINDQLSLEIIKDQMIATGIDVAGYPSPGEGKRVHALCCVRQNIGKPSGNCLG